jgi:hypothetical protein
MLVFSLLVLFASWVFRGGLPRWPAWVVGLPYFPAVLTVGIQLHPGHAMLETPYDISVVWLLVSSFVSMAPLFFVLLTALSVHNLWKHGKHEA